MATKTVEKLSARDRLLNSANELFYREGVNSVGIDRIIEHAGVAKATLYSAFGSKDELIRAYLERRHDERAERMTRELAARFDNPRDAMLGVFDILGDAIVRPTFRGCAFMAASAEAAPGSTVEEVSDTARAWIRDLFSGLAKQAGAKSPKALGLQLAMLYDGAVVTARMDRNRRAAEIAKSIATSLVDAAIPA
jgi:AcrR family transcriptional regulator